jgi:hypothetical protein
MLWVLSVQEIISQDDAAHVSGRFRYADPCCGACLKFPVSIAYIVWRRCERRSSGSNQALLEIVCPSRLKPLPVKIRRARTRVRQPRCVWIVCVRYLLLAGELISQDNKNVRRNFLKRWTVLGVLCAFQIPFLPAHIPLTLPA